MSVYDLRCSTWYWKFDWYLRVYFRYTKDLCSVVSIQTNYMCHIILHSMRDYFFHKGFSSLSHADFSFVGVSDVRHYKCTVFTFKCTVLMVHPAKGQMLDLYQRPDYWVRIYRMLLGDLPHQCPNAGLLVLMQDCSFLHMWLVSDRPPPKNPRIYLQRSHPRLSIRFLFGDLILDCLLGRSFLMLIIFI